MAKQATDANIHAFLVEMAWNWLHLAEVDEWDNWENSLRRRAIQTGIGEALRSRYEIPKDLPHQLLTLLMQLNAQQDRMGA
jgi:hypothetical protein